MEWVGLLFWQVASWLGAAVLLLSFAPYLLWHFGLSLLCTSQHLGKRYSASWALVTGASSGARSSPALQRASDPEATRFWRQRQELHALSVCWVCSILVWLAGIGKSLARSCAQQGLNVVVVARPDDLLDSTVTELQEQWPDRQFRKVAVDLGSRGYEAAVEQALSDICVQVCFLNAGYVQVGMPHPRYHRSLRANVLLTHASRLFWAHAWRCRRHMAGREPLGGNACMTPFHQIADRLLPSDSAGEALRQSGVQRRPRHRPLAFAHQSV